MREWLGFLGFRNGFGVPPVCLVALVALGALGAVACGGSTDGTVGGGGNDTALLSEAPHCTEMAALKIEGTVDGGAISDARTDDINAGLEQFGTNDFNTPLSDLAPLAANQVALRLTWANGLFDGSTSVGSGGAITLPATHPDAGKKFCVTRSEVGFVSGGSEDTAFKFAITEIQADPNPVNNLAEVTCSGATQAVDVRGCYRYVVP